MKNLKLEKGVSSNQSTKREDLDKEIESFRKQQSSANVRESLKSDWLFFVAPPVLALIFVAIVGFSKLTYGTWFFSSKVENEDNINEEEKLENANNGADEKISGDIKLQDNEKNYQDESAISKEQSSSKDDLSSVGNSQDQDQDTERE